MPAMDTPYTLTFPPPFALPEGDELAWLVRAEQAGVAVAPMVVVPVAVETGFYALNNLPEQLQRLFDGVVSDDPDEDDLEELAPAAIELVRGRALLDEVVERLYEAFEGLPERVLVRRAGAAGQPSWRGREALLEVKRLWAAEWEVAAIAERLRSGRGLAPEPRAVLVHDAELSLAREPFPGGPQGAALDVWHDRAGRVARLALSNGAR